MFMLEGMTYKAALEIPDDSGIAPVDVAVQAWTNCYDKNNNEGAWHAIDLAYIGEEDNNHVYGNTVIITSANDFNFVFRFKYGDGDDWNWSSTFGENGFSHVEPPRECDQWTQKPDWNDIVSGVSLGNFLAATNAKECGFTHVLNVADNLDMVYPDNSITYKKLPMQDGACNSIPDEQIKEAVSWLRKSDRGSNKVLINCRAGIGRAGSVAVAYTFYYFPHMSFEEAYEYVSRRRFVYPHYGLKETLYRLYRKSPCIKSKNN